MIRKIISFLIGAARPPKGIIEKAYFTPFLPPNPVIIEAGAHIGTDTSEMAELWKNATIHAFEPVPYLYQLLSKNTEGVSNIHIYPFALGETVGEIDIYISSGKSDASSSLLQPKKHLDIHPNVLFEEKIRVKVTTLDEWAKQYNIKQIDMLWLDIQGFELSVLQNSFSILKSVKLIYTEVNLIENYHKAVLYNDLKKWLFTQGFEVQREELAWQDSGNVLFIKSKISK